MNVLQLLSFCERKRESLVVRAVLWEAQGCIDADLWILVWESVPALTVGEANEMAWELTSLTTVLRALYGIGDL